MGGLYSKKALNVNNHFITRGENFSSVAEALDRTIKALS
jgi:hypothetical protein